MIPDCLRPALPLAVLCAAVPALAVVAAPSPHAAAGLAVPEGASAPPATAAAPARPAQGEELDRDEFMKRFRRAMDAHARSEMANLVRRNQTTATILVIEICEAIARETSERLEEEIAALRTAWKDAFDSRFASIMYEYFSLMRLQVRAFRGQKVDEFNQAQRAFQRAKETGDEAQLDAVCESFAALAEAFDQAGDPYYESECWWRVGVGYDEGLRGGDAELGKAADAFAKAAGARKEIELEDTLYVEANRRAKQLRGSLEREEEEEEEAAADGFTRHRPGVSLGEEVGFDLAFELVEDLEEYDRPGYGLHEVPLVWPSVSLGPIDSTAELYTFSGGPILIRRASAIGFDGDRDGRPEVEVGTTSNVEPVAFDVGRGDEMRRWGLLCKVFSGREAYQGISMSMQPGAELLNLYLAPAASMVGEVVGEDVRVIDENMDGIYGSQPTQWELPGLCEGSFQPMVDSIVLGSDKEAVPWSEYVQLGSDWYQLLSDRFGTRLVAAPARLETGTLKVKAKGIEPAYLVVYGSESFQYCFYDVMQGGSRGLEVPVGTYELLFGEVRQGRGSRGEKALVLPGEGMEKWTVKAGETTVIELGEPFDIDFVAKDAGETVTVVGRSLAVVGASGERYERLWNCVLEPEVSMRRVGNKRGGRCEEMELVSGDRELGQLGLGAAWFPLDLELDKRGDAAVEVRLEVKGNDLFGSIESSWRPAEQ